MAFLHCPTCRTTTAFAGRVDRDPGPACDACRTPTRIATPAEVDGLRVRTRRAQLVRLDAELADRYPILPLDAGMDDDGPAFRSEAHYAYCLASAALDGRRVPHSDLWDVLAQHPLIARWYRLASDLTL